MLIPFNVAFDLRWELDFLRLAMTDFVAEELRHDQPGDLAHPPTSKRVAELLSFLCIIDYIVHLYPSAVIIDHIPIRLPVGSGSRSVGRIGGMRVVAAVVDIADGDSIADLIFMRRGPGRERVTFDIFDISCSIYPDALGERIVWKDMEVTICLPVIDIDIRIDAPGPGRR